MEELKLSKEKVTALESGEIKELNEENQTLKGKIAEKTGDANENRTKMGGVK